MPTADRTTSTREERRERTREELIAAADELFRADGFHPTTLDRIADRAGYTKGAVYSNFESKEDLFFAVYERRAERVVATTTAALAVEDPVEGMRRAVGVADAARRNADGWMPTFFEFWAHVLRHPELKARFISIHARVVEPFVEPLQEILSRPGAPDIDPRQAALAGYSMQLGIQLELLTGTAELDDRFHGRMLERSMGVEEEQR
jgi:AcrR family transcriptional regulator